MLYPDSLCGLCTSLQKVVNTNGGRGKNISSFVYTRFANVLDSEMRLRKLGVVRRQAAFLTNAEEEKLWSSGVLGSSSADQLLNTVFFMAGKNFD